MRRRSFVRPRATGVHLDILPMIDVVFFLLVFYVVAASFDTPTAVTVERPQSSRARTTASRTVPVAVTRDGSVFVGETRSDLDGLAATVDRAIDDAGTTDVLVVADRDVPTGTLLAVMDRCRDGGATRVSVAATRDGPR